MNGRCAKDPENDLFWRFDLRRLEAEELRDSMLAVCGNLNLKMGGPSIYPKIAAVVLGRQSRPGDGWNESPPEEQVRRSVYIHVKRSLVLPILAVFDSADTDASCPVRFCHDAADAGVGDAQQRVSERASRNSSPTMCEEQAGDDAQAQVRLALHRVTQREPTDAEMDRGVT